MQGGVNQQFGVAGKILLIVGLSITVLLLSLTTNGERLKSEKNIRDIAMMGYEFSSSSNSRRSAELSSSINLEQGRRRITLDNLKTVKRDGFLSLDAFKTNPFILKESSSSWMNNLKLNINGGNQHVIVTLKKDQKLDNNILSTMVGQNAFTANVDVMQLESLLMNENVEKVEYFDPVFKFVVSQFSDERNTKRMSIDLNGNKKKTDNKLNNFEPTFSKIDEDWKLTFQNEEGEDFVMLRVIAEETANRKQLNYLEAYLNEMKSSSRGSVSTISKAGSKKFIVAVKKSEALALSFEIAKSSNVFWVELTPKNEVHNYWAQGITQSGSPLDAPITKRGITGKGQIVTVGDSGLDPNSCFFYDPDHQVPYINATTNAKVSSHRKIASYWAMIDSVSENDAHGTHVSGTIASQSIVDSLSPHNGIAAESKIAFTDLGCSDPKGCKCQGTPNGCPCDYMSGKTCSPSDRAVYPPVSLSEDYFPFSYNLGSRIHSNSWGESSGILGYSVDSADIDKFIWEHKDFLVLFSAGNSGSEMGYSSVSTQADSKNIIAVGASMNPLETFQYLTENILDMNTYAERFASQVMGVLGCPAVNVTSSDTCDKISPDVLKQCDFLRTFKTEADCCSTVGEFCENSGCGCAFYSLGASCCRTCRAARLKTSMADLVYNKENIAYFSSRGPSSDGRIKPDIVAPGYFILSARSHNTLSSPMTCAQAGNTVSNSVLQMGGTSMSCPLVSANVALLRQYYLEGWHSTGKNDSSKGFVPSAALMKATLINSGVPLLGYLDFSGSFIPLHDTEEAPEFKLQSKFIEGFGRIQLDRVLMFDNSTRKLLIGRKDNIKSTSSKINTEFGDPTIASVEDSHTYCIAPKISGNMNEVKITLVWTDYPSNPARSKHLINNLDLGVKVDKDIYFGNAEEKNTFERDNTNNVEQVIVSKSNSRIIVNVAASYILKEQSYALLITGENIKFDECTSSDYFEYSATAKSFSSSLGTGIRIFGFDLALVMATIVLTLIVIAAASITTCVFAIFAWMKSKNQAQQFSRLEDETTREL